jgi:hypothetical protein
MRVRTLSAGCNLAAMSDVPEPAAGPCQCGPCLAKAQKPGVRAWRWIAGLDLTKPPAPVLRWLGIFLIGIVYAAAGAPTQLGDWLWAAIGAGALILPDVAGFGIAGMRLDLKQAQDELTALKLRVDVRQTQKTELHLHGVPEGVLAQAAGAEVGERAAKNEAITIIDAAPEGM